jgi:hypothetical protein
MLMPQAIKRGGKMKYLFAIFACILVLLASGCSSSNNPITPIFVPRLVWPWFSPISGPAPLVIRGALGVQSDSTDIGHDPFYSKIEVDFGDGAGWTDVTAQLENYWQNGLKPQDLIVHEYSAPGVFIIRARATYWDGAVVYSESPYERTINVLPPEEAGS